MEVEYCTNEDVDVKKNNTKIKEVCILYIGKLWYNKVIINLILNIRFFLFLRSRVLDEKIIYDYLENKNINYAIMIDGEWGSCKTYFIKNKVVGKYENALYVSLYGISSVDKLALKETPRLFEEANVYYKRNKIIN